MMRRNLAVLAVSVLVFGLIARADNPVAATKGGAPKEVQALIERQEALRLDIKKFEEHMLSLAQQFERSTKPEDREKAELLNQALKRITEFGIDARCKAVREYLQKSGGEGLDDARASLQEGEKLQTELTAIYELLSSKSKTDDKKELEDKYKRALAEIIKAQRDLKNLEAKTKLRKDDADVLAKAQADLTNKTEKILDILDGKNGKKGEEKGVAKDPTGKGKDGKDAGKEKDNKGAKGDESDRKQEATYPKEGNEPKDAKDAKDGGDAKDAKDGKPGGEAKDGEAKDGKDGEAKDGKDGEAKDGKDGEAKDGGEGKDAGKDSKGGEGKEAGKDSKDGKGGESKEAGKDPKQGGEGKEAGKDGKGGEGKEAGKDGKPGGESKEAGKPGGEGKEAGKDGKPGGESKEAGKGSEGKPGGKPSAGQPSKGGKGESKDSKGGEASAKKGGEGKSGEGKGSPSSSPPSSGSPSSGSPSASKPDGGAKPPAGGPQPPQQPKAPGRQQVQDAIGNEKSAEDALKKPDNDTAADEQAEAAKKLEEARKKLEEILKQMREEEMERLLADLQRRCEGMLARQMDVLRGTEDADKAIKANPDKKASREDERSAQLLGDREGLIVKMCREAIQIIEADGTVVAFAESFQQLHDDMVAVQRLLGKVQVGEFTQLAEKDIIDTLKQMIEDLKEAQKQVKSQPGQPGKPGEPKPQKKPLVTFLQELKRLRAMQADINKGTDRIAKFFPGAEQSDDPEIRAQLKNLAEREARLKKITGDIANGRNDSGQGGVRPID